MRTLEKGEAPLDQSITLYQEGDRLRRRRGAAEGCPGADRADCVWQRRQASWAEALRCRLRRSTGSPTNSRPRRGASVRMSTVSSPNCLRRRAMTANGFTKRCAMRRSAAASGSGRCYVAASRLFAIDRDARAARRLRDRGDPRLFADPRRSAVHGRCGSAPRQADRPQGVRRGRSGACRRQPPRAGVRDSRRAGDQQRSVGALRAGAGAGRAPRARTAWPAGR